MTLIMTTLITMTLITNSPNLWENLFQRCIFDIFHSLLIDSAADACREIELALDAASLDVHEVQKR